MPATNESALVLAGQLRMLTDAQLAELLGAREIRGSGIRDFFDLADALLDASSIQHALSHLDRGTLTAIAVISHLGEATEQDAAAHLVTLGADPAGLHQRLANAARVALATKPRELWSVPASVAEQLLSWAPIPSLADLAATPAPAALAPVSPIDAKFVDHVASEHAFATTTSIAELIAELQHDPARELARGGVALPDSKRLAVSMGVDLDRVAGLLEIASRAGLIALDAARWRPTTTSVDWMVDSSAERWAQLASAWLDRLPADIRTILGERARAMWGARLEEYLAWLFPGGGEWMRDRIVVYTRDAELLGITADQVPSTPGGVLLVDGPTAAALAMQLLFPREVEQVYLQHDLSIVSPGPLAPALDSRLRTMADVEGRALASSYRVSTSSLYRAMASGETAASVREFLGQISLTGIPQPLDYLITEATTRYGLVRVGPLEGARTYVRSTDATLLRTLLVDHSLASLGLTRGVVGLESRFDLDLVFWSLSEARYPVAAENSVGEVVLLKRRQLDRPGAAIAADPALSLIERLRLGSSTDPDITGAAWLSRQLDVAIKAKMALTVTVQLPDGSSVEYQLEPASVAGGRLRARDRRADIERTLPLSSIVRVEPAEA